MQLSMYSGLELRNSNFVVGRGEREGGGVGVGVGEGCLRREQLFSWMGLYTIY